MSRDASNISLGTGRLYINNIEVGYLKGDVEFSYARNKLDFKPSGALGPVAQYVISEECLLKAAIAELKTANLKLAMGITSSVASFSGDPSYNPASFDGDNAKVYDSLKFGGDTTIDNTLAVRFEHIRPNTTKKIVVILYTAVSMSELTLTFKDEDFNIHDLVLKGLADDNRPAGDQIGMIIEQTN